MTDTAALLVALERRFEDMLTAVAAGEDIAPAQRCRAEGLMEALVLLGVRSEGDVQASMEELYLRHLGRSMQEDLGAGWQRRHPFPEIPFFMARAPVHRGGSDSL
jgi:hypothetical protein